MRSKPAWTSVEVFIGLSCLVFGAWLVVPWDTFQSAPAFAYMREVAPEYAWGTALLMVGLGKIIARYKRLLIARVVFGIGATMLWTTISILYAMGTGFPLLGLYAVFAALTVYAVVRGYE